MSFWERLARISAAEWGRDYVIYLYRESPKVRMAGQGGYLCKLAQPFSPEDVKARYGGGTFKAMLNKGQNLIDTEVFEVEGIPIFDITRENPNGAGGVTPAAAASADLSKEFISVLREELARNREAGGSPGTDRAMDMVVNAAQRSIEIVKAQAPDATDATKQLESIVAMLKNMGVIGAQQQAGSPVMDKILTVLIERALTPANPMEQLTMFMTLYEKMQALRGEPGKADWKAELVGAAKEYAPQILDTAAKIFQPGGVQQRPRPVPPQPAARVAPPGPQPQPAPPQRAIPAAAPSSSGLRMVPVDESGAIEQPPQPVNVAAEEPFSVVMRKKIAETVHFGEDAENDAADLVNFLQIAWPEGARYLETLSEEQITKFFAMDPILVIATQDPRWHDVITHAKAYAMELLADAEPDPPTPPARKPN